MSEEITTDPLAPLTGEGVKPKRQLTEAQRLAFLKARETRARNVALRREQKMAEETANPPPEKKPRAKRAPKRDDGGEQRQRVKVTVDAPVAEEELPQEETQDVPEQIIDKVVESLVGTDHTAQQSGEPISSLPEMPDPHMYAKLVADIIYEKLNTEIVEPPSPLPSPSSRGPPATVAARALLLRPRRRSLRATWRLRVLSTYLRLLLLNLLLPGCSHK